jgi:hypothetical protein
MFLIDYLFDLLFAISVEKLAVMMVFTRTRWRRWCFAESLFANKTCCICFAYVVESICLLTMLMYLNSFSC